MLKILTALTMSAAAGLSLTVAATMPDDLGAPRFEVVATDAAGNEFVAGAGDDCRAAWDKAILPADWREIICVETSPKSYDFATPSP